MMTHWTSLADEWAYERRGFYLKGRGVSPKWPEGSSDIAAKISELGPNSWWITTWPGPATEPLRQEQRFEGTIEEAKALAVALLRLG